VWAEANRLGCGVVAEHAIFVVGRRLASLARDAEFLALPRDLLLDLLRSDNLAVRSERVVYEAAMGWVRHDAASRQELLGEVLSAVRMALLPPAYLTRTVSQEPLVRDSLEALRIVTEANQYSVLTGAERAAVESDGLLRQRKHTSEGELMVVGGIDDDDSRLKSAEWYDGSTGQWRALPDMSVGRSGCAAVFVEGNVYVVGGHDGGSALRSAEVYDGSVGQWRALPEMCLGRWGCAAACVEGNLYVVGGINGCWLKSAEMYNVSTRQWLALPDMRVPRYRCAAVCLEGNVYVMGGHDDISVLKSTEVYDTLTGQWRALPDMSVPRCGCAAACVSGNVYVVGGNDGRTTETGLKSAEVYDRSTGKWRALPEMSVKRNGCAAACIDGILYVLGGHDGLIRHASVECYDPVTSEWRMLPSMSTARWFCTAAVAEMDDGRLWGGKGKHERTS
jgi:hypothetical protein